MRRHFSVDADDTDRWIVSYADFMTLLLAFFVVMYAISSLNVSKLQKFAKSTTSAFTNAKETSETQKQEFQSAPKGNVLDKNIADKLNNIGRRNIAINQNHLWAEIEIKSNLAFESGSAVVRSKAKVILRELAAVLQRDEYFVSVEGYTDTNPINTAHFPSNWELSATRAAAIARVLVLFGVDADHVSAVGFADNHPISDNQTQIGREENRRVVIIIAKQPHVARLLDPKQSLHDNLAINNRSVTDENTINVPTMKEVRTEGGGLIFTRGVERQKVTPRSGDDGTNN